MFSYVALQILLDLEKVEPETNSSVAILEMSTLVKDLDHFGVLRYVDMQKATVGDAHSLCN